MKVGDKARGWSALGCGLSLCQVPVLQKWGGLAMGCARRSFLVRPALGQLWEDASVTTFLEKKKKSSNGVKTREKRLKVSCKGLGGRGQVVGG